MNARKISHYEILDKLGEGGMGEVYKARDTRLNRVAAIKVLRPEKLADPGRRARFIQEAQAASALNHPNIVTIYGIDREGDVDFIAMEYVQGQSLDRLIGRRGLKLRDTLKCAIQIADALATAHAAGIVHRDLKPGNVMVSDTGLVKVLDFGLAKLTESADVAAQDATRTLRADAPITEKGTVMGTVSYMSPEQAEGKPVDARSDIFSFGSLLYEMATGKRAFHGDSKMSTITSILRDEPKSVSGIAPEPVPRDLEKVIARCLRKDKARRFQHMDDVKVALEELKDESDSGMLSAGEFHARPARRRPLWAVIAGALLVGVVALGAMLFWRKTPASPGAFTGLKLRQLTDDAGFTGYPALSPDGKLLAYSSDRAGDAGLDIWVQQLGRGAQPIRLTKDSADEAFPSFSPDATQIVFASRKEGGGIFVIPSLGGEERLLLRGELFNPRFSPDGQWVAATGPDNIPKTYVVPASGGTARQLGETLYSSVFRAWSPDGKKILVGASKAVGVPGDWWILPLDGGPPVQTGARAVLDKFHHGTQYYPSGEWLEGYVLYTAGNLWRIKISEDTGKVVGEPERLTSGSAHEQFVRAIPGTAGRPGSWRIVFATVQDTFNLWTLPIDLNTAKPSGEPRKLISGALRRESPSLSSDGKWLTYVAHALDSYSLRVREMATGAEKVLLQQPGDMRAKISPSGDTVAYNTTAVNAKDTVIFLVPASGGESRKLCDTCGLVYDWTADGKKIVFRSGDPIKFSTIDVETGQQHVIVSHPKYHVHGAQFSPDGKWLAFHFAPGPKTPRAIYLAPVRDGQPAGESEWIAVMDRPGSQTRPWWSPDGNVLYFLSTSGGKLELWAQRLEPKIRRPVGEPFRVYSPPSERYYLKTGTWFGPGIGPKSLIFPVYESAGNIWMAE